MKLVVAVGRWARQLQLAGLWILLALLPFSKAAVEICFGLLFVGWILERLNPATRAQTVWRSPTLRPVLIGLVSYLAVCALSIIVSDHPDKSLQGFICKWLEYLLFLVILTDLGSKPRVIPRSLAIIAWSSFAVALQALAQEVFLLWLRSRSAPDPSHPFGSYERMTGPYENPIDLATYFMVVIPVLIGYAMTSTGRRRWRVGGLLVLLVACLARTEALGAWLGLVIGLGMILACQPALRRIVGLALGGVVLSAAAELFATGRGRTIAFTDTGTMDRWMMWQAAIRMIADRPWLGHGVNTFMANYLTYWVGGERQPRYAHNCYLQVAAETGLVGLAAFAWLLAALFFRLVRGLRASVGRGPEHSLLAGCLAGLVAFAVQAGYDTNFYALRQAALFWVLAGLACGLSLPRGEGSP